MRLKEELTKELIEELIEDDETLKPCPFCGGKAHKLNLGWPHWVFCSECGAKVQGVGFAEDGDADAIERWNSRVEPKLGWISVKDRLPEEHESIFHKFLGTPKWSSAMWQQESDKVLVCVSFPDGTRVVTTGCLHNSDWMTTVSKTLPQIVTHWMPLPEPPKMEGGETDGRMV